MSQTLTLVKGQVDRFKNGQIDLTQLWAEIDSTVDRIRATGTEDPADPYEDDRLPVRRRKLVA
jgi:hypothetical protein